MSVQIREAKVQDCKSISNVLFEAFKEFQKVYTVGAFAATVINPDQVRARMEEGQVWVAISENQISGTAAGKIEGDDYFIRGMAVLPSARGQKIGLHLLREIETYARNIGCPNLSLCTTPYLKRAIQIYENFGFRIVNDPPHDFYGMPLFSMRKNLH